MTLSPLLLRMKPGLGLLLPLEPDLTLFADEVRPRSLELDLL
jgi:hypothetical protein